MPRKSNVTPPEKVVQFPALDAERKTKVRHFLKSMSTFMYAEDDIEISEVTIIQVKTRRPGLSMIIKKVAANEKKKG